MGPVANTLNPPLLGLAAHIWAGIHVFGLRPERRAGEEPFWTRRDSTATRQRLGGGTASARAELPSAQKQRSSGVIHQGASLLRAPDTSRLCSPRELRDVSKCPIGLTAEVFHFHPRNTPIRSGGVGEKIKSCPVRITRFRIERGFKPV
ncbi:hypothetical protein B0H12DRAFT_1072777 [Mycena haematopus]|nr:hypothetical protein B0H12DRAFT_1072777 [Mycena haematopus]